MQRLLASVVLLLAAHHANAGPVDLLDARWDYEGVMNGVICGPETRCDWFFGGDDGFGVEDSFSNQRTADNQAEDPGVFDFEVTGQMDLYESDSEGHSGYTFVNTMTAAMTIDDNPSGFEAFTYGYMEFLQLTFQVNEQVSMNYGGVQPPYWIDPIIDQILDPGQYSFLWVASDIDVATEAITIGSVHATSSQVFNFQFASTEVAAVPLPAAAWLFLTGLAGFGFFRKKA